MFEQSTLLEWLLLMPLIAGFIGWVTNWLAIKMIFFPRQWVGLRIGRYRLGWQGIIHRKAMGFSKAVGKQVSENMLSADDLLPQIEDKHANYFIDRFPELWREIESGEFLPELLAEHWQKMTPMQRQMVQMQIRFDSRALLLELVKVARSKFVARFDLREVISRRLAKDSQLLAHLFGNIAKPELRMIESYGLYFGALFGTVEAILFLMTDLSWTIFLFGTLIGAVTNWLAIEMIFRPRLSKKILGMEVQGLFPKRQPEIAAQFAEIGEQHVLPVDVFVKEIMIVLSQQDFIDDMEKTSRCWLIRIINNYQSHIGYEVCAEEVAQKAIEFFYKKQLSMEEHLTQEISAMVRPDYRVAELIEDNLSQLPKDEFEQVLRIVFEEDERTLIFIGAAIGLLISGVQFYLFA